MLATRENHQYNYSNKKRSMRITKHSFRISSKKPFPRKVENTRDGINFSESSLARGKVETRVILPRSQNGMLPERNRKFPLVVKWPPPALNNFRNCDSGLFNQTRWTRTCLHATSFAEKQPTSMKIDLETAPLVLFHGKRNCYIAS